MIGWLFSWLFRSKTVVNVHPNGDKQHWRKTLQETRDITIETRQLIRDHIHYGWWNWVITITALILATVANVGHLWPKK